MLVCYAAYVLAPAVLNCAMLVIGLQKPAAAVYDRTVALYTLVLDLVLCPLTALALRCSLAGHWPLPPGWFTLNVRGAARQWGLLLAACATFPALSALGALAHKALGGGAEHVFWEGASAAALRAGSCDVVALCTYVASHTLLAPLWEEAVFRGFLLPSLCRYLPAHGAVGVSALLFAVAHQNALTPGVLLPGVLFGGVYVRTRSLAAPIALHALWNLHIVTEMLLA